MTFLVWNRVRIWRTGRHIPTNNYQEYPPRYLGCEIKTGAERLGKVSITRGRGLFLFYGGGCENRGKRSGVREFWHEHMHLLKKGIKDRPTRPPNQWFWWMLVLHSSKPSLFFLLTSKFFWIYLLVRSVETITHTRFSLYWMFCNSDKKIHRFPSSVDKNDLIANDHLNRYRFYLLTTLG